MEKVRSYPICNHNIQELAAAAAWQVVLAWIDKSPCAGLMLWCPCRADARHGSGVKTCLPAPARARGKDCGRGRLGHGQHCWAAGSKSSAERDDSGSKPAALRALGHALQRLRQIAHQELHSMMLMPQKPQKPEHFSHGRPATYFRRQRLGRAHARLVLAVGKVGALPAPCSCKHAGRVHCMGTSTTPNVKLSS